MSEVKINNLNALIELLSHTWGSFYLVYSGVPSQDFRLAIGELELDEAYHQICIDEIPVSARGFLLNRSLAELTKEPPMHKLPYIGTFVRYLGFIDSSEEVAGMERIVNRMRKEKAEAISFYSKLKP